MIKNKTTGPGRRPIGRRRVVRVEREDLVRFESLKEGRDLPLLARPTVEGVNLATWVKGHRGEIEEKLRLHGGVLFRGFGLETEEDFQQQLAAFGDDLLEYSYRSTPRSQVNGRVYTSTEYPADQHIPMHNEMSYSREWPMKIWFFSMLAAKQGGETPIADSRRVYNQLSPALRQRFEQRRVLYRRNYGQRFDLSWQDVFQTDDRAEVENTCRHLRIELEWKDGEHLTTTQVCQAVARHPVTDEPVWFNQAHLFHVTSLDEAVRDTLLSRFAEEDLPRNTYYGDGSAIEPEALEEIRRVYDQESVVFSWEKGDLLMLDNMLVAHGRRPFQGARRVLVGMAESTSLEAIASC